MKIKDLICNLLVKKIDCEKTTGYLPSIFSRAHLEKTINQKQKFACRPVKKFYFRDLEDNIIFQITELEDD